MKTIQTLLGHSSYRLTADTYTSVLPQMEQEAADAPVAIVPRRGQTSGGRPQHVVAESADPDPGAEARVPVRPRVVRPTGPDEVAV